MNKKSMDRLYNQDKDNRGEYFPDKNTGIHQDNEPWRKFGKWGIAIDDFAKKWSGQESYYNREAREENERYWADYYKNTGIDPNDVKYPNRIGASWNAPIQTMPMMGITGGKRAINMLYGGQE